MLTGTELTGLRTRVFGADVSAVSKEQLQALTAYRDKPFVPNADGHPACAYCQVNEPMCELAAERMDPVEAERQAAERRRQGESDGNRHSLRAGS